LRRIRYRFLFQHRDGRIRYRFLFQHRDGVTDTSISSVKIQQGCTFPLLNDIIDTPDHQAVIAGVVDHDLFAAKVCQRLGEDWRSVFRDSVCNCFKLRAA
jgi:hypothetical protein